MNPVAGPGRAPPPRDSWADALEEATPWRDASFERHYRGLEQACRLAFTILRTHPRREEFLAYRDPLPPESVALLERLRREKPMPTRR